MVEVLDHYGKKSYNLFILYVERFLLGVSLEVVVQRYSVKKVFFKISQNSQENTCVRAYFNFIKKETMAHVFSCEFYRILKNIFFKEHLLWLLLNRFI